MLAGTAVTTLPSLVNAFAPPKNSEDGGEDFTFLFQGDSITDGNRTRNTDWNHVMGHGYAYLVACKLGFEQPEKNFHFFNRGISGNKIVDLEKRWQADTIDIKPDLLSILVGVNDANSVISQNDIVDAARFEETYKNVLKQTKEKLPKVKLVICEPFLLPVGRVKDNWTQWETEMKKYQKAAKLLSEEFDALYVPLQKAFEKAVDQAPADYWIWDGIHPMPAGHELIAREWIAVVKKELGFIK